MFSPTADPMPSLRIQIFKVTPPLESIRNAPFNNSEVKTDRRPPHRHQQSFRQNKKCDKICVTQKLHIYL